MMKSEVEQAVQELRSAFRDSAVVAHPKGDGGAIVTIDPVDLGPGYVPQNTWLKFEIGFQYPYADIYPLFVRPDLVRSDGQSHGEGIVNASFEGEPAIQLSRRSTNRNDDIDTAVLKVIKVIQWLKDM